jgi:putative NADH-flavin reductase
MKLAIIGASRGIGLELLKAALEEGHEVTALLRNPGKLNVGDPGLNVIKGDILDFNSVKEVVNGQDAICVCIGIPPTRKLVTVFSIGTQNVINAIGQESSQKLIVITGIGAGESKGHGGFLYDKVFNPLLLKTIYADKDLSESTLKSSHVNWMIIRPGFLTNGSRTGKYRVLDDLKGVKAGKISRADVADFILKELREPKHFGKTPLLTY